MSKGTTITYREAGVDIDAGHALVERIKPLAARVTRPEVMGGLGGFAGLCRIPAGLKEPILVSGTDGVGTKLKWAFTTGRHGTVGIDLVAMCVNDVLVTGADPLFFLDYFASGRLDVEVGEAVITGIVEGCRQSGCALLGGETAELPGMYPAGEYDLAGFTVGVVDKAELRDGGDLAVGDTLVGVASHGLHSNGHSLARRVLLENLGLALDTKPPELEGRTVAEEALRPTRIYAGAFRSLNKERVRWKAAAHVTGGGLIENPIRFVPKGSGLGLRFHEGSWPEPGVFALLTKGGVPREEMRRVFNLGIGMVLAVAPTDVARVQSLLAAAGDPSWVIGEIFASSTGAIEFVVP